MHIVLVEPEIHWNTGNAGRTCLAVGAQLHLVGPLGFSLDGKQVRRAGLDYWDRVAPVVHDDFAAFERALPSLGEPLFFSADAPLSYYDVAIPARPVLVFGKESVGFDAVVRARFAARMVRLPMRDGAVRSLNVSTCVGIAAYEVLRRQR
jgi:tRNA (cytidine/uridine-2'-O-)-methyltransferase